MKIITATSALAAIALFGVIVLLCLGKPVPSDLWGVVVLLLGGHLGLSTPTSATVTPTAVPGPQPVPGG